VPPGENAEPGDRQQALRRSEDEPPAIVLALAVDRHLPSHATGFMCNRQLVFVRSDGIDYGFQSISL